ITDGNCHSTWVIRRDTLPTARVYMSPTVCRIARQARKSDSWSRDVNSALEAVPAARTRPRWGRARRLWGGLFAVVLLGSLAAPALATWTTAVDLSDAGRDAFAPQVA